MKVIYEKHPVTPERKQQLRSQGYTIIDARFAPKGHPTHQNVDNQAAGDNLENMTLDELKALAKDMGVNIHANSGAEKFIEAIQDARNNGEAE